MVDALPVIALAELLPHEPRHHAPHPLLADDGILGGFQPRRVVVVDAGEGGRHGGLFGEEERGFGRGCHGVLSAGNWRLVGRREEGGR
jgi:hypothetical protein